MIEDPIVPMFPTLRERVSWKYFDRWKAFEGSPRWWFHFPFFETFSDSGWHTDFQMFHQHTYRFRMQKALCNSNLKEIQKIIEEYKVKGLKYDLNQVIDPKYGFTAMHIAANSNQHLVLQYLMMLGAEIDRKDPLGNTPLAMAAMNDCFEATYTLIKSGAKINQKDKYGFTVLQKAKNRHNKVVPYLQQQSKKPQRDLKSPNIQINPKVNKWFTDKWSQFLKNRKIFTGRTILNPFNSLKGDYRILFSEYISFGHLYKQKNKQK